MQLVKLRAGNLFDGPSDLIVLPCSIGGHVTNFVAQTLVNYRIPRPKTSFSLGDVEIRPFEGGENIAQFVAFAASVRINNTSSLEAIRAIGGQLGSFTRQEPTVRAVAAPLLGAGAGGLQAEDVVSALSDGFRSTAHPDAMLTISIRKEDVFNRVTRTLQLTAKSTMEVQKQYFVPRVFISYSDTAPEHKQWVMELATYLRQNGVDARMDEWHLRLGMDLPQWMTNELVLADRVIIICDALYAAKADSRLGGVAWETMIIQGDMMNQPPESNKHIAIVREANMADGTPIYLRTKYCLHWPPRSDEKALREKLLRELLNVPVRIPEPGPPPAWLGL